MVVTFQSCTYFEALIYKGNRALWGLQNCLKFSQPSACLDEAM